MKITISLMIAWIMSAVVFAEEKQYDRDAPRILGEALLKADYVEVVSSFGKEEYRIRIESKVRLIRLSEIVGQATFERRSLTWHGTRQQIDVYTEGHKLLSFAHDGDKLRCFGAGLSGDFYVGKAVCDAVLKWANK